MPAVFYFKSPTLWGFCRFSNVTFTDTFIADPQLRLQCSMNFRTTLFKSTFDVLPAQRVASSKTLHIIFFIVSTGAVKQYDSEVPPSKTKKISCCLWNILLKDIKSTINTPCNTVRTIVAGIFGFIMKKKCFGRLNKRPEFSNTTRDFYIFSHGVAG